MDDSVEGVDIVSVVNAGKAVKSTFGEEREMKIRQIAEFLVNSGSRRGG